MFFFSKLSIFQTSWCLYRRECRRTRKIRPHRWRKSSSTTEPRPGEVSSSHRLEFRSDPDRRLAQRIAIEKRGGGGGMICSVEQAGKGVPTGCSGRGRSAESYTDKKEERNFLIHKEIQRDRVQSHIWWNICAFTHILGWLCTRSHLNFLIYENNFVIFFISVLSTPAAGHHSDNLWRPWPVLFCTHAVSLV